MSHHHRDSDSHHPHPHPHPHPRDLPRHGGSPSYSRKHQLSRGPIIIDPRHDPGLDRVGEYVTRSLLPTILEQSDRPIKVVMNFGDLTIDDDSAPVDMGNSIIYNAPGCSMVIGGREEEDDYYSHGSASGVSSSGRAPRVVTGTTGAGGRGKRVDFCVDCKERNLVYPYSGRCESCIVGERESAYYGSFSVGGLGRGAASGSYIPGLSKGSEYYLGYESRDRIPVMHMPRYAVGGTGRRPDVRYRRGTFSSSESEGDYYR